MNSWLRFVHLYLYALHERVELEPLHAYFRSPGDEESEKDVDAQGKVVYRPSETFKMVHEQETPSPAKPEEDPKPTHSRTFKMLQEKLGAG